MGWAGPMPNANGRMVGYAVSATCDKPDCDGKIDRGLGYVCGSMHDGGEYGCGNYFCGEHLYFNGSPEQLCADCLEMWEKEHACPDCGEALTSRPFGEGEPYCTVCEPEAAEVDTRCEATARNGLRCQWDGGAEFDGRWLCGVHLRVARREAAGQALNQEENR